MQVDLTQSPLKNAEAAEQLLDLIKQCRQQLLTDISVNMVPVKIADDRFIQIISERLPLLLVPYDVWPRSDDTNTCLVEQVMEEVVKEDEPTISEIQAKGKLRFKLKNKDIVYVLRSEYIKLLEKFDIKVELCKSQQLQIEDLQKQIEELSQYLTQEKSVFIQEKEKLLHKISDLVDELESERDHCRDLLQQLDNQSLQSEIENKEPMVDYHIYRRLLTNFDEEKENNELLKEIIGELNVKLRQAGNQNIQNTGSLKSLEACKTDQEVQTVVVIEQKKKKKQYTNIILNRRVTQQLPVISQQNENESVVASYDDVVTMQEQIIQTDQVLMSLETENKETQTAPGLAVKDSIFNEQISYSIDDEIAKIMKPKQKPTNSRKKMSYYSQLMGFDEAKSSGQASILQLQKLELSETLDEENVPIPNSAVQKQLQSVLGDILGDQQYQNIVNYNQQSGQTMLNVQKEHHRDQPKVKSGVFRLDIGFEAGSQLPPSQIQKQNSPSLLQNLKQQSGLKQKTISKGEIAQPTFAEAVVTKMAKQLSQEQISVYRDSLAEENVQHFQQPFKNDRKHRTSSISTDQLPNFPFINQLITAKLQNIPPDTLYVRVSAKSSPIFSNKSPKQMPVDQPLVVQEQEVRDSGIRNQHDDQDLELTDDVEQEIQCIAQQLQDVQDDSQYPKSCRQHVRNRNLFRQQLRFRTFQPGFHSDETSIRQQLTEYQVQHQVAPRTGYSTFRVQQTLEQNKPPLVCTNAIRGKVVAKQPQYWKKTYYGFDL